MHLKTSWEAYDSFIDESAMSRALSSLHSSHTCAVHGIIYKRLSVLEKHANAKDCCFLLLTCPINVMEGCF
jgi:hypothetical protein